MEIHPEGILMEADTYAALVKTIQRDCRVLESFKIMDYSLLVGVHNLDLAQKEAVVSDKRVNYVSIGDIIIVWLPFGIGIPPGSEILLMLMCKKVVYINRV